MSGWFTCPHCNAQVDVGAVVCPECGSDETTGWSTNAEAVEWLPADAEHEDNQRASLWGNLVLGGVSVVLAISAMAAYGRAGIVIGLAFLALAIGAIFYYRLFPNTRVGRERKIYHELLMAARGDEALVERWVDYERSRLPSADTLMLMQRALYRWKRDNRLL